MILNSKERIEMKLYSHKFIKQELIIKNRKEILNSRFVSQNQKERKKDQLFLLPLSLRSRPLVEWFHPSRYQSSSFTPLQLCKAASIPLPEPDDVPSPYLFFLE